MKFLLTAFLILVSSYILLAQDGSKTKTSPLITLDNEYMEKCGSYVEESQTYAFRFGKVTKIIDGSTILFEQKSSGGNRDKKKYPVVLAGIDPAANEDAIKKFLAEKLLNQKVIVWGNTEEGNDASLFGLVGVGVDNQSEINRQLIEGGMAKFKKPGYFYSVSYVTMCIYQQLEEKAKMEKLGIWAK
jgi:endonuclease YncB( thermonuclease family)